MSAEHNHAPICCCSTTDVIDGLDGRWHQTGEDDAHPVAQCEYPFCGRICPACPEHGVLAAHPAMQTPGPECDEAVDGWCKTCSTTDGPVYHRKAETAEDRSNRFWKGTALESVDTMLAAAATPYTEQETTKAMSTSVQKCEHCGSTIIGFDPPIESGVELACGQVKPGTYGTAVKGGVPYCMLSEGHEGDHQYIVEYIENWPALAEQETTNG